MAEQPSEKIPVVFYRTEAGAEVVLDWLRDQDETDRGIIGQDLMRVQFRWPVGMPLCRPLGGGLWKCAARYRAIALPGSFLASQAGNCWRCTASSRRPRRRLRTR